jgi:hypothetical protein
MADPLLPGRRKLAAAAALMHILQPRLAGGREWACSERIVRDALRIVHVTGGHDPSRTRSPLPEMSAEAGFCLIRLRGA